MFCELIINKQVKVLWKMRGEPILFNYYKYHSFDRFLVYLSDQDILFKSKSYKNVFQKSIYL